MSLVVQAQTVGGTVTDEAGVPLPGATVVVLETNQGTTTDFDGNYSVNASNGQTLESLLRILPPSGRIILAE